MDKELEELVAQMVKDKRSAKDIQSVIASFNQAKKDSSEKAEPVKGKDDPVEEHVALTVGSATDDDVAAASIDKDYWAKVEEEQQLTRDEVVAMSTSEGPVLPEHREMLDKVSKEEKLIKSVKGSGDKVSLNVDYSDPKENISKVVMKPFAKDEKSGTLNYGEIIGDLSDTYTRYGFDIRNLDPSGMGAYSGEVLITADFDGNKKKETKTFDLNKGTVRADMAAWMKDRAVDKWADLGESLDEVGITVDDRKTAAETSEAEYDDYLKNIQDLEDAQAFARLKGPSLKGSPVSSLEVPASLEGNKWHKLIQGADSRNNRVQHGGGFYDSLMAMESGNIEDYSGPASFDTVLIKGANEFTQARLAVAERTFRENLTDPTPSSTLGGVFEERALSQKEAEEYRLKEEDREKISTIAEGIDKNDPEVRRIAIDLLSKQKEEGLLGDRIAEVRGDYDHDVLEALGKEKLAKLTEKQEEVLSESLVVKEKYGAVSELLKAAGNDIKNYDAEGKIKAIQSREFKTQEDVDAAKSEIKEVVATHEKLAADYSNKLRNYELIEDAVIKTNEKITNLQVDIEDIGVYTELVGLDYRLASRMGVSLGNAVIDLVQGGVSAVELALDTVGEISKAGIIAGGTPVMRGMLAAYENSQDGSPSIMDKAHAAVDAHQAEWSDSMYHMQYDDIDSAADFGEWFAVMMAGQVPNLALMAATGPASLYVMGITSTGTKYLDLKGQNKLYAETGGLYGNEYSFGEMFLNSTVSGAAEALSERITLGQVNAAKGVFKGMIKNKGVRKGVGEYLKKHVFSFDALKATGKDLLEEGGSEAIATISGNVMDIWAGNREAGFWDGVEESFVSGVAMSGTLKSPVLLKHAMAAFSSPDTDAIREENLIRINELSDALLKKDHELSPEAKEAIEEEIAELTVETTAMLEQDIKRVDILSDNDKKKLLGIERNKRKVLARWEAIQKDESLSETEKEALKDRLQNKLNAFGATKAEMLSQYDPNVADTKYSETTMPLKSPDQQFEENIEFAKKHSALYGLEVDDSMTTEQIREKYGDEAAESDGFVVGNNIVINKEVAAATGAVTVGSHELLHGILRKEMAKPGGISQDVIDQLKKAIGSQWSVVQQRIDDNYTDGYMDSHPDEYLTLVSDAIAKKEIVYEETTFDKLRDAFNKIPMFKKYFPNIKFNTGKDVYRFLREYNKSIHKGALSSDIIKATQGETDAAAGEMTMSMTSGQKKAAAAGVKKLGTDNTNKSWRRGGADAAIKEMKDKGWFDALIASQYKVKPVPKDFVDKVYSEITPHIKRFKPEQNDDLFAYVNSQIGNKAGNVYNREYKVDDAMRGAKDIDAKTTEGAPVIQVEAETDSEVTKFEEQDMSPRAQARRAELAKEGKSESDQYSGLRTELGLEKPMMDKVRNVVMKTFGTKLPDVNSKKFKAALQKAYRNELKKPIQDMIGKGEVYNEFLAKNFPIVYKFLPKETLLQMERNVAPENRIFTKSERITKSAEVDRLISEGLLPKDTNRTSGPTLITKLPYPGTKKVMAYFRGQDMGNTLGYKVGASTLGTRKDKLAMEMGVELGFDATMETVQDPEVAERRESILELTGQAQAENDVSVMAKQIDRDPGIKFSRSSDRFKNQTMSLVRDVVNNGFETVFTEDGKLVEGYPGNFSKKSIDFAYNLWDGGTLHDGKSVGFKARVMLSDKFSQEVKDAFKEDGTLKNNEDALDSLYEAVSVLTTELGPEVMGAIGFEIAGFKNRVMDSPNRTVDKEETARQGKTVYAKDEDGNNIPGRFYERFQKLSKRVRESVGAALPFGLDLKAVSIMNKNAGVNSIFGKVQKILDMGIPRDAKLVMLAELQPEIDAANAANIKLAKHIATVLINGVRDGSIDAVSALHLLQVQTSIVNGFRGLSRLDLITVLDGSQKPGRNHPHYKRIYRKLSKDGFANDLELTKAQLKALGPVPVRSYADDGKFRYEKEMGDYLGRKRTARLRATLDAREAEAIKRTGSKGEHLAPNSNTMFEIAELFSGTETAAELDSKLNDIFRGHSQMHTTIGLTKVMDEKLGATSDMDFNRVKALDQVDIDSTVRADGTPYPIVLAEVEIAKEVSRMNLAIDQRNESAKVMDNARKMSRSSTKPKGITVLDFDDTLATTKSNVLFTAPEALDLYKPYSDVEEDPYKVKLKKVPSNVLESKGYNAFTKGLKGELMHGSQVKASDLEKNGSKRSLHWFAVSRNRGKGIEHGQIVEREFDGEAANEVLVADISKFKGRILPDFEAIEMQTWVSPQTGNTPKRNAVGKRLDSKYGKIPHWNKDILNHPRADELIVDLIDIIIEQNPSGNYASKTFTDGLIAQNFPVVVLGNIKPGDLKTVFTKDVKGKKGKLNAAEFAEKGSEMLEQGYKFDFSEFNKVVDGKTAPLFNKAMKLSGKFGTDNMFILTARAPESARAIKQFLDAQGLNIPLKNITGLGKSEASAKANWIAEKVGEGYNDFYFADDAMQNVKAVKDVLDQFDVKGKVQQARIKFSKSGPKKMADILGESALDIDIILEQTKGVGREKGFSTAKAKQRGKGKGKFKFFLPPSAEDFAGLVYSFLGKGKQGEKHHAWFKENLFDPYSKAIRQINTVKQLVASDMRALRRALPKVKKVLKNIVPGTEYTHEQAIRVYNWARAGMDIPGLSKADQKKLVSIVENDSQLKAFADGVNSIAATPGGLQAPTDSWLAGTIPSDMNDAMDASREKYLEPWLHNKNIIFSEQALNKIEAVYGSNFREALEDVLYRMEYNSNRTSGQGRLLGGFMDWINGSIGATMFFNSRSAVLQTMSSVNFINWSDNNPLKAAAAFANQKQYWADVAMIFNSPFLKQRRSGLAQDVNTAELAEAIKGATNPARAAIGYLLQLGFTPTQIADSFAIASGGATMYRNRIKSLMEGGMTQKDAEAQAFTDFMEIAEETQQSARPDRISQQQASPLGKVILAFQNTPMQYNRLMKKAMLDLANGRGDAKTHISKILYYGAIQNAMFYSLQTALYAMMFGDDDDDDEKRQEVMDKKTSRIVNGMIDGLLRGAGIGGAVVSTLKNVVLEHLNQKKKLDDDKFYTDYKEGEVIIELLNLSPPIGIKARKISSGLKTWLYNRDVIAHMPKTDIDNPIYDSAFSITEGLTNIPLSRAHGKLMNLREAANSDHETWKRVSMFLGWNKWSFGIQNQDVLTAKGEVKAIKAEKAEEKAEKKKEERAIEKAEENKAIEEGFLEDQKEEIKDKKKDDKIKCAAVTSSGKRCGKTILKGQSYCTIHEPVEQNKTGEKTQCKHIKKNKDRCKVQTSNKSGLCYYHD